MLSTEEPTPCMTTDPEIWFSLRSVGKTKLAKQLCHTCPVRLECLQQCIEYEALSLEDLHGVFGGTTPNERRALLNRKRKHV